MKTKEFSIGKIQYRMPNVIESMRLFGKIGISSDGLAADQSELTIMANLIENMAPFILKIEAIKDETPIETWDDALNHVEFLKPLSEIGAEMIEQFNVQPSAKGTKRKKS